MRWSKLMKVLMERDGMTREQAREEIQEAREAVYECIEYGDYEGAEEVLSDFFGLEPDYMDDLLM